MSINDGKLNGGSLGIWKNENRGMIRNCRIYNNTFYNSLEEGSNIWLYDHYTGFQFMNNVFMYDGSLISGNTSPGNELFLGNLYWNLSGDPSLQGYGDLSEWASAEGKEMLGNRFVGLYQDPGLPLTGMWEIDDPLTVLPENLEMITPGEDSPVVDRGVNLKNLFQIEPGSFDIEGNPVPFGKEYDIGAVEYFQQ